MKRMVTLVFLFLGVSALHAQGTLELLNNKSAELCPENAVDCFVGTGGEDEPKLFLADDLKGEDFELATKISPTGSFSRVTIYGFLASEEITNEEIRLKNAQDLPGLEFRINIYDAEDNQPGDEPIESFTLNNVKPVEAHKYDPEGENKDGYSGPGVSGYLCVYVFNLPERVMLDGDGYFSVTRINNHMPIRKNQEEQEEFMFYLLGFDFGEGSDESFSRGEMISERNEELLANASLSNDKDLESTDWSSESFKPVFVLDNPPIVPLGSLGLYIGMALIGGFSLIFLRRKHRSGQ